MPIISQDSNFFEDEGEAVAHLDQARSEALTQIRAADLWFVVTAKGEDSAFYTTGATVADGGLQLAFLRGVAEALNSVAHSVMDEIDRLNALEDEDV